MAIIHVQLVTVSSEVGMIIIHVQLDIIRGEHAYYQLQEMDRLVILVLSRLTWCS